MIKVEKIREGLWTFPVVLPDNPLKWLNCYVIKGNDGGRNLLIDTGFNRPECLASLKEGMETLGLMPEMTDVFMTHLHSDHTGNAAWLQSIGCRLVMSKYEYYLLFGEESGKRWEINKKRALREGVDPETLSLIYFNNPAVLYRTARFTADITVDEGDTLSYGDFTLQCIETPGHTPGHMCLYEPEKKIMFLGDHVLFDITPNICAWPVMEDSLGSYIDSLHKLLAYEINLALPAHRNTGNISTQERIEKLLEHHKRRLAETERIINESGPIDAYSIAAQMTWKIRARNWDEFPPGQKWFAFGETLAHLDYLVKRGSILRKEDAESGNIVYLSKT